MGKAKNVKGTVVNGTVDPTIYAVFITATTAEIRAALAKLPQHVATIPLDMALAGKNGGIGRGGNQRAVATPIGAFNLNASMWSTGSATKGVKDAPALVQHREAVAAQRASATPTPKNDDAAASVVKSIEALGL